MFAVSSSQFYLLRGGLQIPANAKLEQFLVASSLIFLFPFPFCNLEMEEEG